MIKCLLECYFCFVIADRTVHYSEGSNAATVGGAEFVDLEKSNLFAEAGAGAGIVFF